VFSAATPEMAAASGVYVNNCFPCQPSETALDVHLGKALWTVSVQMISDRLNIRPPLIFEI
jgi:hypothetical protein